MIFLVNFLVLGEEVLELGTEAPPLLGPRGQAACVVVQLDGLVDGCGHLDLDLLVRLVGRQPLALDRDHLLWAGLGGGPPAGLGGLGAQGVDVGGDGGDWGAGLSLEAGRPGAADAGCLGALGLGADQLGRLELVELLPELLRGLDVVQLVAPLERVSGRHAGKPLLLDGPGGRGRPGGEGRVTLHSQLAHGGQGRDLEGGQGGARRVLGARLHVHVGGNLLAECQGLVGGHRGLPLLGQQAEDVTAASEVWLATHQDDRSGGGDGADLRTPEVQGGEERPGVGDLVAEQEDVGVPVGQRSGRAVGGGVRPWKRENEMNRCQTWLG